MATYSWIPDPKQRYEALPRCLTVKPSPIHGLGIFAQQNIPINTVLGISHASFDRYSASNAERYHLNFIRTPLGGFINHSETPNCIKVRVYGALETFAKWTPIDKNDDPYYRKQCRTMAIKTHFYIPAGDELTIQYTLYEVGEESNTGDELTIH